MRKLIILLSLFIVICFNSLANTYAEAPQNETLEGVITRVIQEKEVSIAGRNQLSQTLEVMITRGSLKNKKIIVKNGEIPIANIQKYKPGNEIIVNYNKGAAGANAFYITDYIRRFPLLILVMIFVLLVVIVGKLKGIASLLSLAVSFFFIVTIIIPQISQGTNPITIVILASLFIIPITFYISHGLNKKTTVAIVGTFIAIIASGILTVIFSDWMRLTGFISDESSFLQIIKGSMNMKDLLMAGMMIGTLGVINDITVSQSAIVFQLKEANIKLSWVELYKRALNVGQDHIGSMVNTLILVYAGASLPLFLLFANNPQPFGQVINYEIVTVEILRALIGSISLILAVPLTSFIAAIVAAKK